MSTAPVPAAPSPVNLANAITMFRLVLVPIFGVLLFYEDGENTTARLAACAVFVVAVITDKLDGDIARKRGIVTAFGEIADPIADKALIGVALIGLSMLGELPWWITIVILVREVGITILRFVVIRYGVIPASRGGKLKTVVQMVAIAMFLLAPDGVWHTVAEVTMLVGVVITVVTGVDYVLVAMRMRRSAAARSAGG